MNKQPTKENTLYLPIKQIYFDQIIAGTKKEEYREIKDTTAKKYLQTTAEGKFVQDPKVTEPNKQYHIEDYNNDRFPFLPKTYKYLALAVGYNSERDTALVEVTGTRFLHGRVFNNAITFWQIAFQIGNIVELHRKSEPTSHK